MCGVLGTLAGGFFLDFIDSTICNAFKVNAQAFKIFPSSYTSLSITSCIIFFPVGQLVIWE